MPAVAPPQGGPQGSQPQQGGPTPGQGAPGGSPQQGGQPKPEEIVGMISQGLGMLGKMFQGAGGAVSPQEQKQLSDITNSFQSLIQSLQSNSQPQPQQSGSGAPIPQNAAPGGSSQPSKMTS